MIPGKGAQMARSAGAFVQVMAHDNNYVTLKMPSGEVRMVPEKCLATVGVVGNKQHELVRSGKAGRSRWLGRRPKVRGVAMNPVDHPHGGGEGKTSGGRSPVSPWGQSAKGLKTRRPKRSDKLIITRRKKRTCRKVWQKMGDMSRDTLRRAGYIQENPKMMHMRDHGNPLHAPGPCIPRGRRKCCKIQSKIS